MLPFDTYALAILDELVSYYNITREKALGLGTRADGRRPDLPGSATCQPVSGKTMEDIWTAADRSTQEGVWSFYRELGAWASFRQCVRQIDMLNHHTNVLPTLQLRSGCHVLEYGCGVAPFAWLLLKNAAQNAAFSVTLSDVPCEHFEFAKHRLRVVKEQRNLKNVTLSFVDILPHALPVYQSSIDAALVFEVFEHVPDPVGAVMNIIKQLRTSGMLVENFIKHEGGKSGPDLDTARTLRVNYYAFLSNVMTLLTGDIPDVTPNGTRVWCKL